MAEIKVEAESCSVQIKKAFSDLSDDDLAEIEQDLDVLDEVFKDDPKAKRKALGEYVKDHSADLKYKNAAIIRNKVKQTRLVRSIVEGTEDLATAEKMFLNLLEGNNSVETAYRVYHTKYTSQFHTALLESGLDREFASGEYDKLVYQQAYNKANGLADVDDPTAVQIYNVIKAVNNSMWEDMNMAGLDVRYRKDFLVGRHVDVNALILAKEQPFVDDLYHNMLNLEKTFSPATLAKGEAEMKKILSEMYKDMIESRRAVQTNLKDMGPKKSYTKHLKSRKLEFRDGGIEFEYSQKYGAGKSLKEQIVLNLDRSAKTVANVEMLGTDAGVTFSKIADALDKKFTRGATKAELADAKNKIARAVSKADAAFKEVVAPPHAPTTKLDNAINFVRGLQAFTKLGSSVITAAYDINTTALQYAVRTGESQFKAYFKAFAEFTKIATMSNAEKKRLAEMLNTQVWFNDPAVALGGHKGDYTTKFDVINDFFTKAYTLTGVPFQTESSRLVNASLQSHAFTKMIKKGFDKLDNLEALAVKEYGMTPEQFDFIKALAKEDKDMGYLTPKNIMEIELTDVMEYAGIDSIKKARRLRNDAYNAMAKYIDDAVHKGTPTPTAKTKRQMLKSRNHNELVRSVANLTMQFKETAWKIAVSNFEAFSKFNQAHGGVRAGKEVAMYMTMGFVSYTMIESAKRALFNEQSLFEEFENGDQNTMRNMAFDFLNKSSLAPVVSDFAEAATSPYRGRDLQHYALGPTAGMIQDAVDAATNPTRKNVGRAAKHVLPMNYWLSKAWLRHNFEEDILSGRKIRK